MDLQNIRRAGSGAYNGFHKDSSFVCHKEKAPPRSFGIGGNIIIKSILDAPNHLGIISASAMTVAFGEILWLLAVVGNAGCYILMFAVLKQHSELMANGCLATRIVKADSITYLRIGSATNKELIFLLAFPHKPNKSDISGRLRPSDQLRARNQI